MAVLDELHSMVHALLQTATRDQLLSVCAELSIDGEDKTTAALLRHVRRHLCSEAIEESEDGGLAVLQGVQKAITAETTPSSSSQSPPSTASEQPSNVPIFRRDFKIFGQIGDHGQKDKITFLSLMHQIEAGLAKGHKEREVVEAVIRAINPASRLRSYLEGKPSLGLTDLRRVLRSHYRESDATELYYQLSRAHQGAKETPQEFLIRAMDLRQKVRFVSKEVTAGPKYEEEQVREMFRHSLQTGFRSEGVRTEMRPHLQNALTTDEELLEKLNIAASQEEERQQKLNPSQVSAVNSISQNKAGPVTLKTPTSSPRSPIS